ncbi:MAG: methylenetetrahydrofolate--tRNA-(uracil(54)-C(5))-methyltransferase (FADH(2)-oxidizing) TrmFO [Clostridia bacterium]|nr:methylenetetrahydrofolate--tRNA-(uracil(54)-C(5))-methyltransferase (FADH(2)-oxidizing) TrmFO [Clostridia bacterium]
MIKEIPPVMVVGAGLAGCEAAFQLASRDIPVLLYEMKPCKKTPAHTSELFAELVCSNSLRSAQLTNASGLLKEELRKCRSLIMEAADATTVPAGAALAVDREMFSSYITEKIRSHPLITVISEEITDVPQDGIRIIASGPLTSETLADSIVRYFGKNGLSFFDAAAPIVDAQSIDLSIAFAQSRYDKGDADYLNCPMDKEQYLAFYDALLHAETAQLHRFDSESQKDLTVFEGCMPIEVMATRGIDTMRYGPMKPVGLTDPRTGKEPYACVQLRTENKEKTMFNLVGFQTHLKIGEQKRVFSMIPGLENAEFLRYGVMHRNTYLNSPELLTDTYATKKDPLLFFAGQMTGVEGYIESAGSGLVAGVNAAALAVGIAPKKFPETTVLGAMAKYVSVGSCGKFQPMNANFGIIKPLDKKIKGGKSARNQALSERALRDLNAFLSADSSISAETEDDGETTVSV